MTVNPFEVSVRHSLHDLYQHMTRVCECIPDNVPEEELTSEQLEAVDIVDAIESEWVLDPLLRKDISMIQWKSSP